MAYHILAQVGCSVVVVNLMDTKAVFVALFSFCGIVNLILISLLDYLEKLVCTLFSIK